MPHIVDVELADGGRTLALLLDDGRRRSIDAALLWVECPSAAGRVRRLRGRPTAAPDLSIVALAEIGRYGVNIAFSDGHDRGIYPWSYLAALAERPQLEDFLAEASE